MITLFSLDWYFLTIVFFIGLYCMLVSRNIVRQLIGLEIMSKACIVAIILCGAATNNVHLSQAVAMTMILIEVVVVGVGLAIIAKTYKITGSVDLWKLSKLKG